MLANQRLFNVGVTRVREGVTVITDEKTKLARQLDRTPGDKLSALVRRISNDVVDFSGLEEPLVSDESGHPTRTMMRKHQRGSARNSSGVIPRHRKQLLLGGTGKPSAPIRAVLRVRSQPRSCNGYRGSIRSSATVDACA